MLRWVFNGIRNLLRYLWLAESTKTAISDPELEAHDKQPLNWG